MAAALELLLARAVTLLGRLAAAKEAGEPGVAGEVEAGGRRVCLATDADAGAAGTPLVLRHAGQGRGDVAAAAAPGLFGFWGD